MKRRLFLEPVETISLDEEISRSYDSVIGSIGYEARGRRATRALSEVSQRIIGVEFLHAHNATYRENRAAFESFDAEIVRVSDTDFVGWIGDMLTRASASGESRFAIDISSMSRPRIAASVKALADLPDDADVVIDYVYVPSAFEPAPEMPDATEALEPAIPDFAGAPRDPNLPLSVLLGLGYEPERAAAALDELSPQHAIAFYPIGRDERFRGAVELANRDVLDLPLIEQLVPYHVTDPFRCFAELDAIVSKVLEAEMRPLLLPLGPKIFAAVCFVVSLAATESVPVWRVSAGIFAEPHNRHAHDHLVTLRVSTKPLRMADRDGGAASESS